MATEIAAMIEKQYRELRLTPENGDYWVVDKRTKNLLGPFAFESGYKMRDELNFYVRRNLRHGEVLDPFFVCDRSGVRQQ